MRARKRSEHVRGVTRVPRSFSTACSGRPLGAPAVAAARASCSARSSTAGKGKGVAQAYLALSREGEVLPQRQPLLAHADKRAAKLRVLIVRREAVDGLSEGVAPRIRAGAAALLGRDIGGGGARAPGAAAGADGARARRARRRGLQHERDAAAAAGGGRCCCCAASLLDQPAAAAAARAAREPSAAAHARAAGAAASGWRCGSARQPARRARIAPPLHGRRRAPAPAAAAGPWAEPRRRLRAQHFVGGSAACCSRPGRRCYCYLRRHRSPTWTHSRRRHIGALFSLVRPLAVGQILPLVTRSYSAPSLCKRPAGRSTEGCSTGAADDVLRRARRRRSRACSSARRTV